MTLSEYSIALLDLVRSALESASHDWSVWLWWVTGIVAVGIAVEVGALVAELRDKGSGHKDERIHWYDLVTLLGAAIVALGVGAEAAIEVSVGDIETQIRDVNASIQRRLQEQANSATALAVDAVKKRGWP